MKKLLVSLSLFVLPIFACAGTVERVSVPAPTFIQEGEVGDNSSSLGSRTSSPKYFISGDNRYIAFYSNATNLVTGDTNDVSDVFVYDRTNDTIERVSVDDDGVEGNDASSGASISSDGRYVAFYSDATNLIPNDTNGVSDIFVYDRTNDTIERVSVDDDGVEGNDASLDAAISSDGGYVAFLSSATNLVADDTNGVDDVFVYNLALDTVERVSIDSGETESDGTSYAPSISSDGRYVAFESHAANLVVDDTNLSEDVFVRDRAEDTTERVSLAVGGVEADGDSYSSFISANGQFVTFVSGATNLVVDDINSLEDIFVYDRTTDTVERVNISDLGVEADDYSDYPSLSSNGRYVAFYSDATNLVADDSNGTSDMFVYDRTDGTIERVSIGGEGVEGDNGSDNGGISPDGQYVVFQSYATNFVSGGGGTTIVCGFLGCRPVAKYDIFVHDRQTGDIELVSRASTVEMRESDGWSSTPSISSAGRYVVFDSEATNLIPNDTNGVSDIFVYDRTNDTIERVSVDDDGVEGNDASSGASISFDGRYVVFSSEATNLTSDVSDSTDVFLYDRNEGTVEQINEPGAANQSFYSTSISDDGRYVVFEKYTQSFFTRADVFIYDRTLNVTVNISFAGDASSYTPRISRDGVYVAFSSTATNLVADDTNGNTDIFVYDRTNDTIERVSVDSDGVEGNADSYNTSISSDGRYVAFQSDATNLVVGDMNGASDIFVYDRTNDTIERVSVDDDGVEGAGASSNTSISSDGRYVAFQSDATNLVVGDMNGASDIFVYDRTNDTIERVSVDDDGVEGAGASSNTSISSDGRYVAFQSSATNLVIDDTNGVGDIFAWDRGASVVEEEEEDGGGSGSRRRVFEQQTDSDVVNVTLEQLQLQLIELLKQLLQILLAQQH